jgi:hypothetical protein
VNSSRRPNCCVFARTRDQDRKAGRSRGISATTASVEGGVRLAQCFKRVSSRDNEKLSGAGQGLDLDSEGSVDPWPAARGLACLPRGFPERLIACSLPCEVLAAEALHCLQDMMSLCATPEHAPTQLSVQFHRFTHVLSAHGCEIPNAKREGFACC